MEAHGFFGDRLALTDLVRRITLASCVLLVTGLAVAGIAWLGQSPMSSRVTSPVASWPASSVPLSMEDRAELLTHLALPPDVWASLQTALDASNPDRFDRLLLDHMRQRDRRLFFDVHQVQRSLAYIRDVLGTDAVHEAANALMDNLYPEQDGSPVHTVRLPEDIDWLHSGYSPNPETIHSLNRHRHWIDLAMAHRLTDDPKYADKIIAQLIGWSVQHPPLDDPESWREHHPRWWLMDASIRAETWLWTYALLLDSPQWSPAVHSLFLFKALHHGQYLHAVTPQDIRTNHGLVHGQGLLYLARFFPEFAEAQAWEARGRQILLDSMDAQTYSDGANGEQSPNYAVVILWRLLEVKWMDLQAGIEWDPDHTELLKRAVEAYYQSLSPNGLNPAISDSYRTSAGTLFLRANKALATDRYPLARPRHRDVWVFGIEAVDPLIDLPIEPVPTDRGRVAALHASGNYILRSGDGIDAVQINFDAGPKGGLHGHYDLLNFELYGFGRVLIPDPGPYKYDDSPQRQWVISTPAHNTISVDGRSHGPLEEENNPGIIVDQWEVGEDHVQIAAHHYGYHHLPGGPVVGRGLWYDFEGTILLVDFAFSSAEHDYTVSFTLPGTDNHVDASAGVIQSRQPRGNVRVQTLLADGQTAHVEERFISQFPPPNEIEPAQRFVIHQRAQNAVFITLITAYEGSDAPKVEVEFVQPPLPHQSVKLRLKRETDQRLITFNPPTLRALDDSILTSTPGQSAADPSGALHYAFQDRASRTLKYARRDASGRWTVAATIDATPGAGDELSIRINDRGDIGIAYTAGDHLKYALFFDETWHVETVDDTRSAGHPVLAYSRRHGPVIAYHDAGTGELRWAGSVRFGWKLDRIAVGIPVELSLDPDRPRLTRWRLSYKDPSGKLVHLIEGESSGQWNPDERR